MDPLSRRSLPRSPTPEKMPSKRASEPDLDGLNFGSSIQNVFVSDGRVRGRRARLLPDRSGRRAGLRPGSPAGERRLGGGPDPVDDWKRSDDATAAVPSDRTTDDAASGRPVRPPALRPPRPRPRARRWRRSPRIGGSRAVGMTVEPMRPAFLVGPGQGARRGSTPRMTTPRTTGEAGSSPARFQVPAGPGRKGPRPRFERTEVPWKPSGGSGLTAPTHESRRVREDRRRRSRPG